MNLQLEIDNPDGIPFVITTQLPDEGYNPDFGGIPVPMSGFGISQSDGTPYFDPAGVDSGDFATFGFDSSGTPILVVEPE